MRGCPDRTDPTIRPDKVFIHAGRGIVTRFAELPRNRIDRSPNPESCARVAIDASGYLSFLEWTDELTGLHFFCRPDAGSFSMGLPTLFGNEPVTKRSRFANERWTAAFDLQSLLHLRRKCLL